MNCPLRTDMDFRNKSYVKHHQDQHNLIIEKLPIGCVTNVPIDYMHAVLLGVMHQLLILWVVKRKKPYSIKKK